MFIAAAIVFGLATSAFAIPSTPIISLPAFYSPQTVAKFTSTIPNGLATSSLTTLKKIASDHLHRSLALGSGVTIVPSASFQDNHSGVYHNYVTQAVNGVVIANSVASVSTDKSGNIISQTSSWVNVQSEPNLGRFSSLKTISPVDALVALAASLGIQIDGKTLTTSPDPNFPESLVIHGAQSITNQTITVSDKLYKTASSLRPVWECSLPLSVSWISAFVDKETGKVLGASDWSSSAVRTEDGRIIPQGLPNDTHTSLTRRSLVVIDKRQRRIPTRRPRRTRTTIPRKNRAQQTTSSPNPTAGPDTPSPNPPPTGNIPPTSYRVIPLGGRDPLASKATLVQNPFDKEASPLGWHDKNDSQGSTSITSGNNVIAHDNSNNSNNPSSGLTTANSFDFDFQFDDKNQDPSEYKDASVTNVFFLTNAYHDILFKYGFDEQSGNFQQSNIGGQGRGNDAVLAHVQDGSGLNNANFNTPPDGRTGVMRMFLFDTTNPKRDAAFDNGVVLHELTHGLSNRLTGGPSNSNCLQRTESGGMGEGWSDLVALVLEMVESDTAATPKPVGVYVTNDLQTGIRQFPYSTDLTINTHTYSKLSTTREVHDVGEVWATMLFEVYWNMVGKLGFTPNLKDDAKSGKGNAVFLQILVDGMKLQPCNPTFIQARDAIIQADKAANNGANLCEIQKGFAKRGLGINAQDDGSFVDDSTVDPSCS
ncbi:hypothetical protein QVD99_006286 [Batrachochytrium dendrobatidis]|nr:hypothetical protein O5D80_003370 [Batrachochytrium dendrobatidis]KAK5667070.1 hypothetical protein QVD99_006286 [Batrachochytrium dendrobatidis]